MLFLGLSLIMASCGEDNYENIVGARTTGEFSEMTHKFGEATIGEVLTTKVKLKNTGDIPLKIHDVKPSCGCTTPNFTKEPILPGEEGEITMSINTLGMPAGSLKKSVVVIANMDPIRNTIMLEAELKEK